MLKIAFGGDICPGLTEQDTNCLASSPNTILDCMEYDFKIANLECPIVSGHEKPIYKTGPNLSMPVRYKELLKSMKLDAVTLANNHIGDYGDDGVRSTLCELDNLGILHVGAGENIDDAYHAISFSKEDVSASILSICENEFGVAEENKCGVAGYDVGRLVKKLNEEKKHHDHVIVMMHGGNEFNPLPSPGAQRRYRCIVDFGATAVIGTHTHCPQGFESYHGGIIVYSLGNYYFPSQKHRAESDLWNAGYICVLRLDKAGVKMEIVPHRYFFDEDCFEYLRGEARNKFIQYLENINSYLCNPDDMKNMFKAWSLMYGKKYAERLKWSEDISDEKIKKKQTLEIQNMFRCEAHRELLQTYFELWSMNLQTEYDVYKNKIRRLQKMVVFG